MSGNEYAQIGWIGLGQIGDPAVTRLLDAGIEVGVYSRSPGKAADLQTKGVKVYPGSTKLIRAYPIISLTISDYAVALSIPDEDTRKKLGDKIIVNMSTITPSENLTIKTIAGAAGGQFAEAPVSGSVGPAINDTPLVLFGGEEGVLNPLQKVFDILGKRTFRFGNVDKDSDAKLVLNSFLDIFSEAYSEAMLMAQQFSIDTDTVIETVGGSAMDSPMLQTKRSLWANRESPPVFALRHASKNLNLTVNELEQTSDPLPAAETVVKGCREVARAGYGEQGVAGVYLNLVKE